MTVTEPCLCSREDVQRSQDWKPGLISDARLDRAIRSTRENIEGHLHRQFIPVDEVRWWDWPNYQGAWPWRLWFDRHDILCLTAMSAGTVTIPLNMCFLRPANPKPGFPWRWLELDRSSSAVFGGYAPTPQNNIKATGTWGFTAAADEVTALPSSVTSSATSLTVPDSSQTGIGDLLILGYARGTPAFPSDTLGHAGTIAPYQGERILVTDKALADISLAQSGSGCTTASDADTALSWTGSGSAPVPGEVLQIDQEQLLVLAVNNATSTATVDRAWNGTVLAAHTTGTEIYAYRSLTVQRGILGTTAAIWPQSTAVFKHRVPGLVRDLAIAESGNRALQEVAGYSRTVGAGEAAMPASGMALADLWDEVTTVYGRKNRLRVI